MFKNVFYNTRFSRIYLWEQIKGENLYSEIDWIPYVFLPSTEGEIKTIDGMSVQKVEFNSYSDYYQYQKENSIAYEDKVKPEIQFLAERYHGIPDDDMEVPKLCAYYLDIEIYMSKGFPKPGEANDPVVSIAIHNALKKTTTVFGLKEYNGKWKKEEFLNYIQCRDEEHLLRMFFIFMDRYPCDVISGWNVMNFDLFYLINRTKKLFGEDTNIYKTLSPVKIIRIWEDEKKDTKLDIAGVTILDYMDLYKKYAPEKRERYSLDFVSKCELEKGKVDYSEYKDLNELYNQNYDRFVEYNIMDTYRPMQLEEKLGYIRLVQALSLLCKVPMKFYHTQTQLIEGLMITHLRRNGLCAPHFYGGIQESFEAAFVKEPIAGMHEWICDFDIESSYPTAIVTLNMSNETYYGRIRDITEDQMICYVRDRNFPPFTIERSKGNSEVDGESLKTFNLALEKRLLAVAPCGSVFHTKPEGVLAQAERYVFNKRKEIKGKRDKIKHSLPELRGENLDRAKERAVQFDAIQNALKTMLNAAFGITAVPYSRYFNLNISEAITSCGRKTRHSGEHFVNDFFLQGKYGSSEGMVNILRQIGITSFPKVLGDMVAYGDTDSLYARLGYLMDFIGKEKWSALDDEKKIHYIRKIAHVIEEYINDKCYKEVQRGYYNSAVTNFRVRFRQEVVAKAALFVKKKKYSMWIVNEEGVPVDRIKTTGLEIVRSETPEVIRPMLIEIMEMILKGATDNKIIDKFADCKVELKKTRPEGIAVNIGIRGISKYIKYGQIQKGAPWHVKGVYNYRGLIKYLGLEDKYEDLEEGNKTKVVYLKPNIFGYEEISFLRWPKEFDGIVQIDYDKQIENNFTEKIKILLEPMGKTNLLSGSSSSVDLFF